MRHPPDTEVAAIGRDADAFEAFYRAHLDDVRRFVARRTADPHTAADLTADVFLAAIERADSYRPERGRPGAWLIGIARNVIADHSRRQARELRSVSRLGARPALDDDSLARLEATIDAEREARRLHASIQQLSDDDRALLELVALDGLTVADAARVLGVKANTARVRLHRARRHLTATHRSASSPLPTTLTQEISS